MLELQVHDAHSAPESSRPILEGAKKSYGFVPNLLGTLAEAPALLEGYTTLSAIFEKTSLSATERQVVLLQTSFENGCEYCMAAHSAIAGMQGVGETVVRGLRDGTPLEDAKLEALRNFVRKMVRSRGWVSRDDLEAFVAAGYTQAHVLEVILGIGLKTMSNFANHIASTPLDPAFESQRWVRPESDQASG